MFKFDLNWNYAFSLTKTYLKLLSGKWQPFCLCLNVSIQNSLKILRNWTRSALFLLISNSILVMQGLPFFIHFSHFLLCKINVWWDSLRVPAIIYSCNQCLANLPPYDVVNVDGYFWGWFGLRFKCLSHLKKLKCVFVSLIGIASLKSTFSRNNNLLKLYNLYKKTIVHQNYILINILPADVLLMHRARASADFHILKFPKRNHFQQQKG